MDLLGKKIVKVRPMTKEEIEAEGWYTGCTVIELDDGTLIFPMGDEEGNMPGSLIGRHGGEDYYIFAEYVVS